MKKKSKKKLMKKIEDLEAQIAVDKICIKNREKIGKENALQLVSDVEKIIGSVAMVKDLCNHEEIEAIGILLDDIDESLQTLSDRYKFDLRHELY